MFCSVLLLTLLSTGFASGGSLQRVQLSRYDGRVVGGEDTLIQTYPYQISLQNQKHHDCGGSIISKNWVITAGHCVYSDADNLRVRAGSTYTKTGGSIHQVDRTILHENFLMRNDGVPVNDVALVHVVEPFVFDETRQAISMFEVNEVARLGSWAVVTGWGMTNKVDYEGQLQSAAMPIVSIDVCKQAYQDNNFNMMEFPEGQICAGYYGEGGRDACQGDSGGPLTINGRLVGIVSWGDGCGEAWSPGVYTEVAHYRQWINKHIEL